MLEDIHFEVVRFALVRLSVFVMIPIQFRQIISARK